MRSTVILHIAQSGGPPQHIRPWLESLAACGTLEVIAPAHGPALELYAPLALTTALDYSALSFPSGAAQTGAFALRQARAAVTFRSHLRRTRPDLVLVVTSAIPSALVGARAAGIPTIVYAGELLDQRPGIRGAGDRLVKALVERLPTAIVCASRRVQDQFASRAPTVTVHPGIDLARVSVGGGALRSRLGRDRGGPCLAVIGNVTRGRGQDLVIRALGRLEELPQAWLLIAGAVLPRPRDLEYERELRALVAELSLTDRVVFAGFVDPIADVLEMADTVINAKRRGEGLGVAMLEALVAGKPVVSTSGGGLTEVLADGSNALLIDDDDVDALVGAVLMLWRDPQLRERLAAQGRADVLEKFDEATSVRRFLEVVDGVLA